MSFIDDEAIESDGDSPSEDSADECEPFASADSEDECEPTCAADPTPERAIKRRRDEEDDVPFEEASARARSVLAAARLLRKNA
jgi:hypothetical protein